jgi:hypothetical protein
LEKPVPSQSHYSFPVVDFRFGLFMDNGFMPFPLDLKNVHISQKFWEKNMLPQQP